MPREHIHFVTGRLAESALRQVLADVAPQAGFDYSIDVLGITVAALMTPAWIASRISVPPGADRVMIPGYCAGDVRPVRDACGLPVERGPRDLRRLPEHFGKTPVAGTYGGHDIEILAEINHCPRRPLEEILGEAERLSADGADVIDVGCEPGATWSGAGPAVRALRDAGHRVSIDTLDVREIEAAVRAGAELVLSVNSTNRRAATGWGVEVVAIPDEPRAMASLDETTHMLTEAGVRFRIDPILEPIGCGFADSLARFLAVRGRDPSVPMLMGIGNLTELTDADSCGVNVLLLGFCQELGIKSVLTTQVINWARTSVRECDLARQLVHYAVRHHTPPKHVEPRLVLLRDAAPTRVGQAEMARLAGAIKDHNIRIFAEDGGVHVISAGMHLHETDPFRLFARLLSARKQGATAHGIDPNHAFYLGYEMCKAATAVALGKSYEQDEPLDWGFLTPRERHDRRYRL